MASLLAPENIAFAVALLLLFLLVVAQFAGLGHVLPHADLPHADIGAPDGAGIDVGGGLGSLLGFGKLPLIIWLSLFLGSFALLGLSIQHAVTLAWGGPLAGLAASGVALVAALPVNGVLTHLLAKVWPRDETTAVTLDALLAKRGFIAVGKAQRGNPARATVKDRHGQMHNVMVEPHDDGITLEAGQEILLVRREGELFYALDGRGPIMLD